MLIPPDTTQLDLARAYLHSGEHFQFIDFHLARRGKPLHPARHAFIERAVARSEQSAAATARGRSPALNAPRSAYPIGEGADTADCKKVGEGDQLATDRRPTRRLGARPKIRSIITGRTGIGVKQYPDGSMCVRWDDKPMLCGDFGGHERVPGRLLEVMEGPTRC